jgi:pantoate--beta-alanine ligase
MTDIIVLNSLRDLRDTLKAHRKGNGLIGLVPTMGALHEGHLSLTNKAKQECETVVVSIFVNPLQFGPVEDFQRYPRTLEQDVKLAGQAGASIVFAPGVEEMYPEPQLTYVDVEKMTEHLCGAKRPGHFRGVTTVVTKLFNMVQPDKAYFGQKDAQQAAIIKKMVKDLAFPIEVVVCPTSRESDGLARSSRNTYLKEAERKAAPILYQSLQLAYNLVKQGEKNAEQVVNKIQTLLSTQPLVRIDYIEIVDANTLQPVSLIKDQVIIAIAVFIGVTRLIDNIVVDA